jgi:hypothetical protein
MGAWGNFIFWFSFCNLNWNAEMQRIVKAILIIIVAILIFAGLILTKMYISVKEKEKAMRLESSKVANIHNLQLAIKGDSLYEVKDVNFRDSAILIAVDNPEKSGTEAYFDKKYKLNGYENINMVYIYKFDSGLSLQTVSFDDALMAKGKKLGKFQDEWVARFIDSVDGSCRPLKNFLKSKLNTPASFKNQETIYQPESIHRMQVVCKYRSIDSSGTKILNQVTAIIDSNGTIISVDSLDKSQ